MDAVGPFRYQRGLVAGLDGATDSVTEFILAGDTDAPQDRTGHLGEEGLNPVEPGGVGWGENEFEAAKLGREEVPGLLRAVGGVIVTPYADQYVNWIYHIELLQECDELAAAVAPGDGMMNNAGDEVGSRRERHGAEPLVFVVALDGGCLPGLGGKSGAVVAIA